MSNELYQSSSWEEVAGGISCAIHFNAANDIFQGHFPGNPIVPGVCTLQVVKDLLERGLGRKLRLATAANIKFLQLITPEMQPTATVSWSTAESGYMVNAILKDGAATLFKMNALYTEEA